MAAKVDSDKCIGCGMCVDECPLAAVLLNDDTASVDDSVCVECGICVDFCSTGAISL